MLQMNRLNIQKSEGGGVGFLVHESYLYIIKSCFIEQEPNEMEIRKKSRFPHNLFLMWKERIPVKDCKRSSHKLNLSVIYQENSFFSKST